MAKVTEHYDNLAERQAKIYTWNAQGYWVLHDDYDPDWVPGTEPHGTLTFTNTERPKTPEKLADEADRVTCEKYLAKSPSVITESEIWWLLRYFGKQLGYKVG